MTSKEVKCYAINCYSEKVGIIIKLLVETAKGKEIRPV